MKKKWLGLLACIVALFALFSFAACGSTKTVTVEISQTTATVDVGSTLKLTASASDGSEIVWETSDDKIASVSNGTVRGVGEGRATVTAKCEGGSATCEVEVVNVIIQLSQTQATVEKGQTLQLSATASDGSEIQWDSSDGSVATVSAEGLVTAVNEGTASVRAKKKGGAASASCSLTVVWSDKPADYYEIVFGEENVAAADPGTFYYWNDRNWCGSNVIVESAEHANGTATFTYSGATSACWFGMQIFYKAPANEAGKTYKLECVIASQAAGDITVNGNVYTLVAGENRIEAYYTETAVNNQQSAAASLSIQAGNSAAGTVIEANTISISALTFTEVTPEKLAAPTALAIAADKTVTVTDSNGEKAEAFKISFLQGGQVKYEQTVKNGDKIDDSVMDDGVYDVTASAVGSGLYVTSDASPVLATYTVANGGVSYDLFAGGETDAVGNPGRFYFWTEFAGITGAKYEDGRITFTVVNGGNWYSNQIFCKVSANAAGTVYTLSCNIRASAAGKITLNGKVFDLVEGDNALSVEYTEGDGASFSLQIGTADDGATITAGDFTIENITFTEKAA